MTVGIRTIIGMRLTTGKRITKGIRITIGVTIGRRRTMTSGPNVVEKHDRQADMDGPLRCSSLTLEREEQLKSNLHFSKHFFAILHSVMSLITLIARTLDRGFESRLRHGCLSSSFYVVLSCVGRGLATS
jgi:hypothetical protein